MVGELQCASCQDNRPFTMRRNRRARRWLFDASAVSAAAAYSFLKSRMRGSGQEFDGPCGPAQSEYRVLSSTGTLTREPLPVLAAACERLVRPGQADPTIRALQGRLLAALALAPVPIAMGAWMTLPALVGAWTTLAATGALFLLAWSGILAVCWSGRHRAVAAAALGGLTACSAALCVAAGGLASPAALVLLLIPLEAWLVGRDRSALALGCAAALAAGLSAAAAGGSWMGQAAAWQWLLPALCSAFVLPRLSASRVAVATATPPAGLEALEQAIDGFALRMMPTGDVLDCGPGVRSKLGVTPELMLGTGLFDRLHVGDRVAFLCALSVLRDGPGRAEATARVRIARPEGRPGPDLFDRFDFEFSNIAMDQPVTAVARPARAAPLEQQAPAAVPSDGLEAAKQRFLAAVSHELRTPLNSIIGFSDVLLHDTFGALANPKQREYVELVRASGLHLLAVVNAILDVSKIEAGAYATIPEPFGFREAVDLSTAMLAPQAREKAITVEVRVPADIGLIRADRRAIQQVLINLLSNALKFTPNEGAVCVGAKRVGSRLHFWVADSGIGMSSEDLGRIGRPFAQVQNDYTRRFEGTGLGLALVRGLVSLHHGTMAIDSAVGKGTTVTISLPTDGDASSGQAARQNGGNTDGTLRKAG